MNLKYPMSNILCFTFVCLIFLSFIHPAYGEEKIPHALKVYPVIIPLHLSPEKTSSYEITVENISDSPLPLHVLLRDFQAESEDGGYIFTDTQLNPLLSWVHLSQTDLLLSPHEKKTVGVTLQTPSSINLGGYYGMIFFEPVVSSETTSTRILSRVGALMLADIGVQDASAQKAQILQFSLGGVQETSRVPLLLRVKNISLHYFTAKPFLTLTPLIGEKKIIQLEEKIVFPYKVRRWSYPLKLNSLPINLYKAHIAVSTGNGEQTLSDTYLLIVPYKALITLLLILIVTLIIVLRRRNIKKALTALFQSS